MSKYFNVGDRVVANWRCVKGAGTTGTVIFTEFGSGESTVQWDDRLKGHHSNHALDLLVEKREEVPSIPESVVLEAAAWSTDIPGLLSILWDKGYLGGRK